MNLKSKAILGVQWTTLSTIIVVVLQMLQLVILSRLLQPDDFGLMAMVMIVIGFARAYADAGISAAIIHHQDVTSDQLSSLYWLNIAAGIVVMLFMWLSTPLIILLFSEPRLSPLVFTVGFGILIISIGKQFEILLQKNLEFDLLAKQQIAGMVVGLIVSVIIAFQGFGVWALVWGLIAREVVNTMALIVVGREFYPSLHFDRGDLKGFVGFGLYQMGEKSINFLSERLDQLLIGSMLGTVSLGFYAFAMNLVVQPINRINPIANKVTFPVFAKVQKDKPRLQSWYLAVIHILTSVNAAILIGFAVIAPLAVPLIFGEKWTNAVILVQILSLVALMRSVGNPVGSLLLANGRADLGFKWNWFLLFLSLPTVYIGVQLGGAVGIAIALLILQIVLKIPSYIYLIRPLTGSCANRYLQAILKPIILASLMGMVVWFASSLVSYQWVSFIISVLIGGFVYAGLFYFIEREKVEDFWKTIQKSRT